MRLGSHHGTLTVGDLDGDSRPDLLGLNADERLVFVHRSTGASVAPVELWHTDRAIVRRVRLADGTGDGLPDPWMVDDEGEVRFSPPTDVGSAKR